MTRTIEVTSRACVAAVAGAALAFMAALPQTAIAQTEPPKATAKPASPKGPELVNGSYMAPQYPTASPEVKRFTNTTRYLYVEQRFDPPYIVQPAPRNQADYSTPEGTMRARASALANLDYDWWLECWDSASRPIMEKQPGKGKEYWIEQWRGLYAKNRFRLVHRIETRGYVILTYNMVDPNTGADKGNGLEYPIVYKRENGRWYASQDLARDPLPVLSPWVTGLNSKEVEVR
jgi:hypothetical protein